MTAQGRGTAREQGRRTPLLPPGLPRVWLLSATLTLAGVGLLGVTSRVLSPIHGSQPMLWLVLAAALFVLAEVNVVHMDFGDDAHSFSASEIFLVAGLFVLSPWQLVLAHVAGGAVALTVHRRQPLIKLGLNLALILVRTCVALLFLRLAYDSDDPLGPPSWFGVFGGVGAGTVVSVLAISVAIGISSGTWQSRREVLKACLPPLLGSTVMTSLGMLAAVVLVGDPRQVWLLAFPALILLAAYRAYMTQQSKHSNLEFLYDAVRLFHQTPDLEETLVGLLTQARTAFHASQAELTLLLDDGTALRTAVGPGEALSPLEGIDVAVNFAALAEQPATIVRDTSLERTPLDGYLVERGIRDGMFALLRGESGPLGFWVVGNRLGDVTSFSAADLALFDALTGAASVALENVALERTLTQVTELQGRLAHQAYHDPLTGLPNRTLLRERVNEALRLRAEGGQVAVLFIDLDDFKTVNDTLGHAYGDELLLVVAKRLRASISSADVAARLGGDEFAVLVAGPDAHATAGTVAADVVDALAAPLLLGGEEVTVSASVGVAQCDAEVRDADDALRQADLAMYTAKTNGKGRVEVFAAQMQHAVAQRHTMRTELEQAMRRHQLWLAYQPIVDLATSRPAAVEALVRWQHPVRGFVSPAEFVPFAEETGLIVAMGSWILRQACTEARVWQDALGPEAPAVTVNISPIQFQQDDFVAVVATALARSGLDPRRLILEITEGLLLWDANAATERLHQLRQVGIRIAVDDFGTGYSSLSYLRQLPVDMLKLAKPFVDDIEVHETGLSFAHAIVRLGQTLHLGVIAEGIETERQLDGLHAVGCDYGQGYLFARPLTSADLRASLGLTEAAEREQVAAAVA